MSKDILVFIEQRDGVIQNVSYELCGAARELASKVEGSKVCAVVIGDTASVQANELKNSGADTVYYVQDPCLKYYLTETYAKAFETVIKTVGKYQFIKLPEYPKTNRLLSGLPTKKYKPYF